MSSDLEALCPEGRGQSLQYSSRTFRRKPLSGAGTQAPGRPSCMGEFEMGLQRDVTGQKPSCLLWAFLSGQPLLLLKHWGFAPGLDFHPTAGDPSVASTKKKTFPFCLPWRSHLRQFIFSCDRCPEVISVLLLPTHVSIHGSSCHARRQILGTRKKDPCQP